MSEFLAATVLIILFIIRFAIPFMAIIGIANILDRLQNHWLDESGSAGSVVVN